MNLSTAIESLRALLEACNLADTPEGELSSNDLPPAAASMTYTHISAALDSLEGCRPRQHWSSCGEWPELDIPAARKHHERMALLKRLGVELKVARREFAESLQDPDTNEAYYQAVGRLELAKFRSVHAPDASMTQALADELSDVLSSPPPAIECEVWVVTQTLDGLPGGTDVFGSEKEALAAVRTQANQFCDEPTTKTDAELLDLAQDRDADWPGELGIDVQVFFDLTTHTIR